MVSLHWCTWALSSCSSSWCHCSGFSCCTVQALGSWASAVAACRLSWLYCMWDLPRPGKPPIHKFLTHSSAYGLRMDSFWGSQYIIIIAFSSVQSLSRVQLLAIPWIAARQASLSITNSWSWLNSCLSSRWCHPAISSSVVPSSSCPQSLLASGSFPMSQLFTWGGQSTGVSASTSVLPMNTQD